MARVAERMGCPLYPWQRYVVDVALEVDPSSGEWVYDEVVITVPRQSGKTFLVTPVTFHRCATGRAGVWLTAQSREKAVDRWAGVRDALFATPLRSSVTETHGVLNERVRFPGSGSFVRPFAPNDKAMHGEAADLVWVDELWSFSAADRRGIEQGYESHWSVKPGQAWLLSAAGTPRSEWLNDVRREGRRGVEDGVTSGRAFFEWSAPETVDGVPIGELEDEQLLKVVVDSHPRRDHGIRIPYLAGKLSKVKNRSDFLRPYGNLTQSDEDDPGLFVPAVLSRARSGARIPGDARIALGVSVDPDRRESSIGVCWRNMSGVAVTDERRAEGTRWVVGEIVKLVDSRDVAAVAIVAAGPARNVAEELDRAGVQLLRLSRPDYAAAAAGFVDELSASWPSVTWNGSNDFAAAVAVAQSRRAPSGLVLESRTGAPITALDARTLAVWAADHAPAAIPQLAPEIW